MSEWNKWWPESALLNIKTNGQGSWKKRTHSERRWPEASVTESDSRNRWKSTFLATSCQRAGFFRSPFFFWYWTPNLRWKKTYWGKDLTAFLDKWTLSVCLNLLSPVKSQKRKPRSSTFSLRVHVWVGGMWEQMQKWGPQAGNNRILERAKNLLS